MLGAKAHAPRKTAYPAASVTDGLPSTIPHPTSRITRPTNLRRHHLCGGSPAVGPDGTVAAPVALETLGGVFTPLLETGCPIPCQKKEISSTASDNLDQVMVALYRGRVSMVRDATFHGRFQIKGIPPMKHGEPQIEVTVAVRGSDLVMEATDLQTSRPYKIVRLRD